ncbi:hypothetical protein DESUT3_23560 [Desulfuromonas versatilis]|uniref:TIGR03016 family PEP-CTERM system-associated outer membrane protein n=1 Tax=Desulfuromonas versatilis TaxID=2802975 RepID=A0ABM8HX38_9BACT|nr:TIGR03016 family PEP-CTERM system-associated outer membrane protein [Desulfuromonas versatilis]BCR05287.1 hypothetical protein DESUT3_23560 [Desulfuromonas versatilis]
MNRFVVCIVVIGLILGNLTESWARVDFKPYVSLREEYTDNLFLDPADESSDYITTVLPGLGLLFDSNYLNLDLDYGLKFQFYERNTEEEETDPSDTQRIRAVADFFPERDFTLRVSDELTRVTVDERRQVVDDNPVVNKTNRNRLLVNPQYRLRVIKKFRATAGYQYEKIDYDSSEGDDSERHAASLDLEKDLLNNSFTLLGGVSAALHDADSTDDYHREDAFGGGIWRVNPKLTLEGRAGVTRIEYSGRDDFWIKTGRVGGAYKFSSRWAGSAYYSEEFNVSVNDGSYKNRKATASLAFTERVSVILSGDARRSLYQRLDREDRAAGGDLVISIPLRGKVTVDLHGDWEYLKFLPEDETAHRYGGGANIGWQFKVVRLGLGYKYRENSSNVDVNDYRNNICFAEANFRF